MNMINARISGHNDNNLDICCIGVKEKCNGCSSSASNRIELEMYLHISQHNA